MHLFIPSLIRCFLPRLNEYIPSIQSIGVMNVFHLARLMNVIIPIYIYLTPISKRHSCFVIVIKFILDDYDFVLGKMRMASPKLKNRKLRCMSSLSAFKIISFVANALTSIINVEFGK